MKCLWRIADKFYCLALFTPSELPQCSFNNKNRAQQTFKLKNYDAYGITSEFMYTPVALHAEKKNIPKNEYGHKLSYAYSRAPPSVISQ